jgi:cytochrome c2
MFESAFSKDCYTVIQRLFFISTIPDRSGRFSKGGFRMMSGGIRLVVFTPFFLGLTLFSVFSAFASDIAKGKMLYEEKRCGLCHTVAGQGGKLGPDLTEVGNRRDSDWLTRFLKDPKGTMPGAKMMPVKATPEEITALVDYLLSLKK